jgi:hypothetical protein
MSGVTWAGRVNWRGQPITLRAVMASSSYTAADVARALLIHFILTDKVHELTEPTVWKEADNG